jgi:hypothetical protein
LTAQSTARCAGTIVDSMTIDVPEGQAARLLVDLLDL